MNIKRTRFAFIFLTLFFSMTEVSAQKVYFSVPPGSSGTTRFGDVLNAPKAADNDLTTAAELICLTGNPTWIQLKHSSPIPAGITSFVRIDLPGITSENLNALISVNAYSNSSETGVGNIITSTTLSVVAENQNETYLAITPSETYNSIRISYKPTGIPSFVPAYLIPFLDLFFDLLITDPRVDRLKVYDAFFGDDLADCGSGWTTTYANSSGNAGSTVAAATNAVDANPDSYSTITVESIKNGTITVSQTIYFSNLGSATDLIRIYLSEDLGFNKNSSKPVATAQAFLNETEAGNFRDDLLSGITQTPLTTALDLKPGTSFNRVKITVSIPQSAAKKIYALNIHGVQILPLQPSLSLLSPEFCKDAEEPISISSPVSGLQYRWYEGSTLLTNPLPYSYSPAKLSIGTHVLSVTAARPGCPESDPATVTITVNPRPIKPEIKPY